MDGGITTPVYNSPELDYPASYRSFIARPNEFADSSAGVIIENPEDEEAMVETIDDAQPRFYTRSVKPERRRRDIESRGFEINGKGVVKELDSENFETEVKSRYSEKENRAKRGDAYEEGSQFFGNNAFKKVQVTEEETGTQRVQVNAGYENPKITCVSGSSCSGVVLKFVLTFHGTNELNTAQRGMPCMY